MKGLPFTSLSSSSAADGEQAPGSTAAHPRTPSAENKAATRADRATTVKIYPSLAHGMLRQERAAAGRVWLLLRALDTPGRGMVTIADARAALTGKESPLRLCGWRRLRQLLAEGEGIFWAREKGRAQRPPPTSEVSGAREAHEDRLRLHGPARVAAALGVARLVGRPVAVPLAALLGPIGDARAHLYATFHSGRAGGVTSYERRATSEEGALHSSLVARNSSLGNPISRDTLTALSGVCARSQAAYERRAGVATRANIALGERVATGAAPGPAEHERAWQRGRALFRLRDHHGHHGRKGAIYLAWRLPNAFGPAPGHQQHPKGQQKRINRQLADLFTKGMTGNSATAVEKRFYGTAAAAKGAEITNYELRITNEERARRSSLATRHSSLVARHSPSVHWPLRAARPTACRLWATVERGR